LLEPEVPVALEPTDDFAGEIGMTSEENFLPASTEDASTPVVVLDLKIRIFRLGRSGRESFTSRFLIRLMSAPVYSCLLVRGSS
jgi:hypothetical protein